MGISAKEELSPRLRTEVLGIIDEFHPSKIPLKPLKKPLRTEVLGIIAMEFHPSFRNRGVWNYCDGISPFI